MELVERLPGDHSRGCDGRNYVCSCGYDDRVADEIERLRATLREIADTTHKQQLPITAQVHDIARAALNGDRHD